MKKRYLILIICVLFLVGIILVGWNVLKNNKVKLIQTEYSVNYGTIFKASDVKYEAHDNSIVPVLQEISCVKIGTNTYTVNFEDSNGKVVYTTEISILTVDDIAPTLEVKPVDVVQFDEVNMIDFVKATDNVDGDLISKVSFSQTTIDTSTVGTQTVDITVSDNAGNKTNGVLTINVTSRFRDVDYERYVSAEEGISVYSDYQCTNQIGTLGYRDPISVIAEVVGYDGVLQISYQDGIGYIQTSGISDTRPSLPVQKSQPSTNTTPSSTPSTTTTPQSTPSSSGSGSSSGSDSDSGNTVVIPRTGRGGGTGNGLADGKGDAY